jgi:putative transport protein
MTVARHWYLPAGVFVALMLVGDGRAGERTAHHRVTVLLPETGPFATQGNQQKRGYRLAEARLQKEGADVQVRYLDTGPPRDNVRDLIYQQVLPGQPDLIVGPYDSKTALATAQTLANLDLPLLIPAALLDELTQRPRPGVFRIATPLQILSLVLADFLARQKADWDFDRIVILGDESLLYETITEKLTGALQMHGLGDVSVKTYAEGSPPLDVEVSAKTVLIVSSHSPDDCIRLCDRYRRSCRIVGFLLSFASPAVRRHIASLPRGSYPGLYCVVPWQGTGTDPQSAEFIREFQAKYTGPFEADAPDYHAAEAYSALLVAARALAEAERTGSTPAVALRQLREPTPLGDVRFINYVDYYQQYPGSATVARYGTGEPEIVYPLDRVVRLDAEREAAAGGQPTPVSPLRLLLENQMIALFVVLSVGLLLGRIRLRGVGLGMSAIFLVGMPLGYLGFTAPDEVSTLGVIFLLYGVGLGAGPTFFRAFGMYGKPLLLISLSMVLAGAATALAFAWLAHIPADLAAGIFTGSMKSSSGFASAIDRLPSQTSVIAVGYGISYAIGLVAIVLFVQVVPAILHRDAATMASELDKERPIGSHIERVMVELVNPAIMGQKLAGLDFVRAMGCRALRVLQGEQLVPVGPEMACASGLNVLVAGRADHLPAVVDYLGHKTEARGIVAADDVPMEIVVTSPKVAGKSVGELHLVAEYGVTLQELSRLGQALVPTDDLLLQRMDVLQVSGPKANVEAFAAAAGNRPKVLQETDMLSLAVGIALGVIIGMIPIGLPGSKGFALGMAGGPMLVALLLSHFGRVGGIIGHFPPATQLFLVRLGLSLLLAGASVKAGAALVAVFSQQGPILIAMAVLINAVALATGLFVSRYTLRRHLLECLAAISGGTNATPAYEVLASQADSRVVLPVFTSSYAITMILMVLTTQAVIAILQAL